MVLIVGDDVIPIHAWINFLNQKKFFHLFVTCNKFIVDPSKKNIQQLIHDQHMIPFLIRHAKTIEFLFLFHTPSAGKNQQKQKKIWEICAQYQVPIITIFFYTTPYHIQSFERWLIFQKQKPFFWAHIYKINSKKNFFANNMQTLCRLLYCLMYIRNPSGFYFLNFLNKN